MERNNRMIKGLGLWLVLFAFILSGGCASKEEKMAKHLARARQYVENGELKKAVIEYKNVVQLNSNHDQAYYELGETHLKLKQGREGFQAFSRAVSVNPENLRAQLKLGQLFLLGKKTEEARKKAESILEKSPDHIEALSLLSGVRVQEGNLDEAIKNLEKIISINPDHFKSHLSLARLFLLKKDMGRAEKAYRKAMALDPQSRVPYLELSRIYASRGEWDRAEAELKTMMEISGRDSRNFYMLARFYESRGNQDQAERTFLEAVESSPQGEILSLMNLAAYYARVKNYDKALEAMIRALDVKPDDPDVLVNMAKLHFDFKKIKEAESTVDIVLKKDEVHVGANYLKGRIFLAGRQFGPALERFDVVLAERPRSDRAHYFKALCLIGEKEPKLAQTSLLKAVELNPRHLDARLLLSEFYLRERSPQLAHQQIEEALGLSPRNIRALMLQGNLNLLEKDIKGALVVFNRIVEIDPAYTPVYVKLGLIHGLMKKPDEAIEYYKKAMALNPNQLDALSLMVGVYLREKKYDHALEVCETRKQNAKGKPAVLAGIHYLEGNIYQAQNDLKKAEELFRNAIETDPNILAPYISLARIYLKEKRLGEAISQYESILNKNPKFLAGYMALGTIYDQQGDKDKAEGYYRKALEIKNDFAPAANNLAWNLVENGGNIDEALGFARIAKEKMPKSASVMDTLGWIYYLKGSYLNAISELQDSLEGQPDHPVVNYHLGMAFYKADKPDSAREYLEKALKIDPDFKGADEARATLEAIQAAGS